jgi:glycosyltransferase involved in cell wall biosynthesis
VVGAALFGEEDYTRHLHVLTGELGLEDAVEFTGFRTDVPQLVESMDILVHASILPEPFGQVVIEGMAAGKPVIATDGGGVTEIMVHGVTGLLVKMGDEKEMADAILQLLNDPALAQRMGEAGSRRVIDHFTIQRTADRVQSVYDYVSGDAQTTD